MYSLHLSFMNLTAKQKFQNVPSFKANTFKMFRLAIKITASIKAFPLLF